jgi:hypothetical protein
MEGALCRCTALQLAEAGVLLVALGFALSLFLVALFANSPAAYGTRRSANNSSGGTANSSANYGPTGATNYCSCSFAGAAICEKEAGRSHESKT